MLEQLKPKIIKGKRIITKDGHWNPELFCARTEDQKKFSNASNANKASKAINPIETN